MDAAKISGRIARYDTRRRWLHQRDVFGGLGGLRELGVFAAACRWQVSLRGETPGFIE